MSTSSSSSAAAAAPGGSALVVCDMQPDLLKSISTPSTARDDVLTAAKICIMAAIQMKWTIIYTGLRFRSRYEGVSAQHKLYGAFRKLNEKVGDKSAHWFMEGCEGSEIDESLLLSPPASASASASAVASGAGAADTADDVVFVWRDRHLPPSELLSTLRERNISTVTIVGVKASHCVQATAQMLCDQGFVVTVVREAIQDDKPERLDAVMTHLLPIYADVVGLETFIDGAPRLEGFSDTGACSTIKSNSSIRYVADCRRSGHMHLYASALLRKGGWRKYPTQTWYSDAIRGKDFLCPLGKQILDFCDEPAFTSKISMFIRGREWLDEKEKIVSLAGDSMPKSYVIQNGEWADESPSPDESTLFFLKEAEKNGGKAVQVYRSPAECLANALDTTSTYVVQGHIASPLLTADGYKCHVKVYCLLHCDDDGTSWTLYTCKDCYLSVASERWSPTDVSREAQITTLRSKRLNLDGCDPDHHFKAWPGAYGRCQSLIADIVGRAIDQGRLRGRKDKAQQSFEIFSADFMLDEFDKLWCIEFNFTPVLYDSRADQPLTTRGLRLYDDQYKKSGGKEAEIDDGKMIADALDLIFGEVGKQGEKDSLWDLCATMEGTCSTVTSEACSEQPHSAVASFRRMLV